MTKYPFYQVDAFTEVPLGGNPCAVLLDTDGLEDETMQAIALEMNLSETAFVRTSTKADFGVRYFTPAEEIPLAGHPTIATTFALVEARRLKLKGSRTRITFEMKAGVIPVDILAKNGQIRQIVMTQNRPQFLQIFPPEDVAACFGLAPDDILPGYPIQVVSTGTPQLMVPVRNQDVLRKVWLDVPAYAALRERGGFFSPHLFCLGGVTPEGATFARHFGVPPDTPEDPFTGSATGGMGAYLWHYSLISGSTFIADQGHWMGRPGQALVELVGVPHAIENIKVGGKAALVVRGELII